MPTKDGNKPTPLEINEASIALEKKVNQLIQEFKDIYNEPAVLITEGATYKHRVQLSLSLLGEQYQN